MSCSTISVLTVVGARPQFIKAAPVSAAFVAAPDFSETMVHTGQHFDQQMSDVFFADLGMSKPAVDLGVHGGSHGQMTGRMLMAVEEQIALTKPDFVLVYGDTNSTLAGALAAAKLDVKVVHVEAGLRSFNRAMPEEINRVLTDHASDVLFCPTRHALSNLQREGIVDGVHWIGDVMYDACRSAAGRSRSNVVDRLGLGGHAFAVATVHRAENVDSPAALAAVFDYLKQEADRQIVVLPIHPRTRQAVERSGLDLNPLHVCEPLGYLDMATLLATSTCVFTDSGGLQKEAYFFGKPCVTLRNETEWVETIENGWNRLWRGPDYVPRRAIDEYGTGHASDQIITVLREYHAEHRVTRDDSGEHVVAI